VSAAQTAVRLAELLAAVLFVRGLHDLRSPRTARRGNLLSAVGMGVAVAAVTVQVLDEGGVHPLALLLLLGGVAAGAVAGVVAARRTRITSMPQLVSLFNTVGGGAAALVAVVDASGGTHGALSDLPLSTSVPVGLDVLLGAVTFSGSLVAAGKLQGVVPGRPLTFPGGRPASAALLALAVAASVALAGGWWAGPALAVEALAALGLGVLLVLPIGGADMPVVISLLNAVTGTAVAMAGLVIDNTVLITAGALVGASGAILTQLMARAMNRSLLAIISGGFGTGDAPAGPAGPRDPTAPARVRVVTADDVAVQLAYARTVVVIPGFGLAAARGQQALVDLATTLERLGVTVRYAVHPVAGRMPGHMNVLLAEARVPYEQVLDLEGANRLLPHADVALVVGANDVVNPLARDPSSPIGGMPVLDADAAAAVVVLKRSLGHGYAGLDNPLFDDPRTSMLLADAATGLDGLRAAVDALAMPAAAPRRAPLPS